MEIRMGRRDERAVIVVVARRAIDTCSIWFSKSPSKTTYLSFLSGIERGFNGRSFPRLVKMAPYAALTQDPSKFAQLGMQYPLFLTTGQRRYCLPQQLESFTLICETKLKPLYLVALLRSLRGEKCIVFTSSVESTHRPCTLLNYFDDVQIKGNEYLGLQHQSIRSKTLKAFRAGKVQVLMSSDATSHGMDVEGGRNVISYDIPPYIKTYIHLAGRTARAGQVKRFKTLLQKLTTTHV